jgi:hypothetical protein
MTGRPPQRIAILGWGSLIWDKRPAFDDLHEAWLDDGPMLPLEFSRMSGSRSGALTLVIDPEHGHPCRVQYALSRRTGAGDVIGDLRLRERRATPTSDFTSQTEAGLAIPLYRRQSRLGSMRRASMLRYGPGSIVNFSWEREMGGYEEAEFRFTVENALDHTKICFPRALHWPGNMSGRLPPISTRRCAAPFRQQPGSRDLNRTLPPRVRTAWFDNAVFCQARLRKSAHLQTGLSQAGISQWKKPRSTARPWDGWRKRSPSSAVPTIRSSSPSGRLRRPAPTATSNRRARCS